VHQFFYTMIIALANNFDNVGVRIAYSIKGIRVSMLVNMWISVITFIISFLAAYSGTIVSSICSKQLATIMSMVILASIGLWMICDPYINNKHDRSENDIYEDDKKVDIGLLNILSRPEIADIDNSKHIDFKEATLLGIALSLNNIGGGLSAGMIGLNSLMVGLLSAIISFIAMWAGNYIAEFFIRWNLDKKASFIAGIVLIGIGIEQIL